MSYDVSIGDRDFNYTSNTSALIYDHIPAQNDDCSGGIHAIHGKRGWEAAKILGEAFGNMNNTRHKLYVDGVAGEPKMTEKYDAANGWGSTIGTILFLGQIMAACIENPYEIVAVSA